MSGVPSLNQELGKRGKGLDHVGLPSGRSVISRFFRCVIFRTIFLNHQAVLMKNLFSFPSSSLPQVHCQNRFKIRKERTKFMKNLIAQIQTKPALYQQSQANIWTDPYLSKPIWTKRRTARHAGKISSDNPQPGSHPSCRLSSIPSFSI